MCVTVGRPLKGRSRQDLKKQSIRIHVLPSEIGKCVNEDIISVDKHKILQIFPGRNSVASPLRINETGHWSEVKCVFMKVY